MTKKKKMKLDEFDNKSANEFYKRLYETKGRIKGVIRESKDKYVRRLIEHTTPGVLEELEFDYRALIPSIGYSNPLSLGMDSCLREGLIKTYPIDKVMSYIRKFLVMIDLQVNKERMENGEYRLIISFPNIKKNLDKVIKVMDVCGYFLAYPKREYIPRDCWVSAYFEPKFEKDVTDDIRREERVLYHVTPFYNLEKIRHLGFSPRSKNGRFDYPDRIYFVRGTKKKYEAVCIGPQLDNHNKSKGNDGRYAIFTLDVNKIPDNVRFCLDGNYMFGVYTKNNIPPSAISEIEIIDFNDRNLQSKYMNK